MGLFFRQPNLPQYDTSSPRSRNSSRKQKRCKTPARVRKTLMCEELEPRLVMSSSSVMGTGPIVGGSSMMSDDMAVLSLVPYSAVTSTAIRSGNWSDPNTWKGGVVPAAGANVLIPAGDTVTVDSQIQTSLHTIRDDGTLQFSTTHDSSLLVDTVVVTMNGTLLMGTPNAPIPSNVHATLTFSDTGAINTQWDPLEFSRGLISMGTVDINGATTTPYEALAAGGAHQGDTVLNLYQTPTNWHIGDQLVLTGTDPTHNQDELLKILAISGNQVTVSPLAYNHVPPTGQSVYVADLTRNVMLTSQNTTDPTRAGHVMFMETNQETISYACFDHLGRTDKSKPVTDPQLDANGNLIPGTGTNDRGRYAMHFHHDGVNPNSAPINVTGNVVEDSPGWGYVNHDSNVNFTNNVSYNVTGAGFVTESGDEIGSFNGNLAIREVGDGTGPVSRNPLLQDFGHAGEGFWFQGPGVKVTNNIAVGAADTGFFFDTVGLTLNGMTTQFLAANLPDPSAAGGRQFVTVDRVPINFVGNSAFGDTNALQVWNSTFNTFKNHPLVGQLDNFSAWGISNNGITMNFTGNINVQNVWLLGNLSKPTGIAIATNGVYAQNITYTNDWMAGWAMGIQAPGRGNNVINGGYYNNIKNIDIPQQGLVGQGRVINIQGTPQFGTLSPQALGGAQQYNIYMESPKLTRDISLLFKPEQTLQGTVLFQGKQVYYAEQAANYVPFPTNAKLPPYVPPQLIGLTNQQLYDQFGIAVDGVPAPADAMTDPTIHGLLGSPVTPPSESRVSPKYTNNLTGYVLSYVNSSGQTVTESKPTPLQEGWNLITRNIGPNAAPRSFLVFANTIPPTFTVSPKQSLVLNPADLSLPFNVTGTYTDPITGSGTNIYQLTALNLLPVLTRPDGTKYISPTFTINDAAGNSTVVTLQITLDTNAKP
jgi:hypothetical protein